MQIPASKLSTARRDANPAPFLLFILIIVTGIAACSATGQRLNSERIEHRFGSYGVDVLRSEDGYRVSSLYSGTDAGKVTRTFAVVSFSDRINAALAREHSDVRSGKSVGAVFKSAGWTLEKHNVFVGELTLTAQQNVVATLMHVNLPEKLASHVYLLVVRKDDHSYNYASIVELHHPDYLTVEDLRDTYGEIIFDDSNRNGVDDFIDPGLWEYWDNEKK